MSKTQLSILIILLALMLAFAASIAITASADAADPTPPKSDRWTTTAIIKRDALLISARVGRTAAFNRRCGLAVYHFGKALKSWKLQPVRRHTRDGWRAMRACKAAAK